VPAEQLHRHERDRARSTGNSVRSTNGRPSWAARADASCTR
jgi:hypothetical protein